MACVVPTLQRNVETKRKVGLILQDSHTHLTKKGKLKVQTPHRSSADAGKILSTKDKTCTGENTKTKKTLDALHLKIMSGLQTQALLQKEETKKKTITDNKAFISPSQHVQPTLL